MANHVNIQCNLTFPDSGVAKIAIVEMPGIGYTVASSEDIA